jgi:hypothetical protein
MLIYHALFAALIPIINESLAYRLDKLAFLIFFVLIVTKQVIYAKWLLNVESYRQSLINNSSFHNLNKYDVSLDKINQKSDKLE